MDIRHDAESISLSMSKDVLQHLYQPRANNLHIILACSAGEAFRSRCRQFPPSSTAAPSLVQCLRRCSTQCRRGCPRWSSARRRCEERRRQRVDIHISVTETSARFYEELAKFYTTPKSYLDLINLYTLCWQRSAMSSAARSSAERAQAGRTKEVVEKCRWSSESCLVLKEKSEATEVLLVQVAKDKEEAAVVEEKARLRQPPRLKRKRRRRSPTRRRRIGQAMPALERRFTNALNKADIVE